MINTYNESSLHRTIKQSLAKTHNGKTEQNIEDFICDVVTMDRIYEVQTGNLSSLYKKASTLCKKMPVTIVYPLCANKIIQTKDEHGKVLSTRKSPKKESIFRLFREITGLIELLDNKNFCIKVLVASIKEIRIATDDFANENLQLANKNRRYKKNWYKADKELICIEETLHFNCIDDYANLVKNALSKIDGYANTFCKKDLQNAKVQKQYINFVLWFLKKTNLIKIEKKSGRTIYYTWC